MNKWVKGGLAVLLIAVFLWLGLFALFLFPEKSATVVVDIPNREDQLVIREYKGMRDGDIVFYLRRKGHRDKCVGEVGFNEPICPIANGTYELNWSENGVTVHYLFSSPDVWQDIFLDLST